MASNEDWHSAPFRQKVIFQIEEAVKRSRNPNVITKNPSDMERVLYSKAKTRADYLGDVARLLINIRDTRLAASGQQQTSAVNMNRQPGMRLQFPSPEINKPQTVSTMGGQGAMQQVPMPQVQQSPMVPQQVFYNKSGLMQAQILGAQHFQQQQQQQPLRRVQTQQQQQQQHPLTTQSLLMQMTQSQPYIPPNQVASPMPVQQQPVHQVQQAKHAVQVRMPHVPSPGAGPNMSSNSMRASTPSASLTSQATVAPSPAPFVPSPAIHPSPSPQHYVLASPAASTSVPTPSTMNVQSPASVPNPASVGAPAASPAPLNPAEEQAYLDKPAVPRMFLLDKR